MYGPAVNLPYRFRLDVHDTLKDKNLDELREAGVKQGEREPEWLIADEAGKIAQIFGAPSKPLVRGAGLDWLTDYFMIIKSRNACPGAEEFKSLVLAGCHGPGSRAAAMALKDVKILKLIEDTVGDADFQALGRVSLSSAGDLVASTIAVDKDTIKKL